MVVAAGKLFDSMTKVNGLMIRSNKALDTFVKEVLLLKQETATKVQLIQENFVLTSKMKII